MDERLYQIWGQRPAKLRWDDCPALASVLVDVMEGAGRAYRYSQGDHGYVVLVAGKTTIVVLASDWAKLVPYLKDELAGVSPALFSKSCFRPALTTTPVKQSVDTPAALRDPPLYGALLALLQSLFPEKYPVSNL